MTGLAERLQPPVSVPFPGAHLGLRWRPLIASDAPKIAALIRQVEDADDAISRMSVGEIADMVEGENGYDLVDTIVGFESDGNVGAVASVRVIRNVDSVGIALVKAFVHPRWRGRGLGRALLYWQDGRARQLLVQHFGGNSEIPASIMNKVDSHMTDRRRLCIAAGFYAKRTFSVMYRNLDGSEQAPQNKEGYAVVPWQDADHAAAKAVHMESFGEHFLPEMRQRWWEEAVNECEPRWSRVVVDPQGKTVGYILTERPATSWVATGQTEAYVSLVGISRDHRGRGVLRMLFGAAIAAAASSGMHRIGLDVDTTSSTNAHEIYEHLGFIDWRSAVYYSIDH
ncbi:MAG: GNAT family N-acetyltransferase [Actinobacteria bacterium]|nr:MAG: GNAT family N-acetyltransferase [Actinomycetota bacterium]